jgi:hypothetical protein
MKTTGTNTLGIQLAELATRVSNVERDRHELDRRATTLDVLLTLALEKLQEVAPAEAAAIARRRKEVGHAR